MTIQADDLATLRIDRNAARRRPWLPWVVLVVLAAGGAFVYPSARDWVDEQRAPEVDVTRVTQMAATASGGSEALPVLVATGYVVARHSSDVGVKVGGRIATLRIEEGTRVRQGQVIAQIEHADIDAQLEAARRAVAEADAQRVQAVAARGEDARALERQRALMKDGITTDRRADRRRIRPRGVRRAREVGRSGDRQRDARGSGSPRKRWRTPTSARRSTASVIRKRAEVGETVSPFGVAGQATREGGAIATIADLNELEVQTEVSENSVAKLAANMPAAVKLQAYPDVTTRAGSARSFRRPIARRPSSRCASAFSMPMPTSSPR